MSKQQRSEKQRAIERLLNAGAALSNIAYNLAQRSDNSEHERDLFQSACRDWDSARAAYREATTSASKARKR